MIQCWFASMSSGFDVLFCFSELHISVYSSFNNHSWNKCQRQVSVGGSLLSQDWDRAPCYPPVCGHQGLGAAHLHHLVFRSIEIPVFRGEPEAQTNGSELITILNDTFSNFLLILALLDFIKQLSRALYRCDWWCWTSLLPLWLNWLWTCLNRSPNSVVCQHHLQ